MLVAACGLVLAAGTAPALADAPLGAVAFVGRLKGHVGVARGIVATADGGRTWQLERYTSHRVHEVQFPTAQIGFALSRRGVLATTDGGAHWTHRGLRVTLAEVDFLGPRVGWGLAETAGGPQVVRTRDGGRTWKQRGEQARSVCFTSPSIGWIGKGRKVLFTHDGGSTWGLQFTLAHRASRAVVHCTQGGVVWALLPTGRRPATRHTRSTPASTAVRTGCPSWPSSSTPPARCPASTTIRARSTSSLPRSRSSSACAWPVDAAGRP